MAADRSRSASWPRPLWLGMFLICTLSAEARGGESSGRPGGVFPSGGDPAPTPVPVLLSAGALGTDSIDVRWSVSQDPRLSRYELWRESLTIVGVDERTSPAGVAGLMAVMLVAILVIPSGREGPGQRGKSKWGVVVLAILSGLTTLAGLGRAQGGRISLERHAEKEEPEQYRSEVQGRGPMLIYQTSSRQDTAFMDLGLRPGKYAYYVVVLTGDGLSSRSEIVEVETLATPTPMATSTATLTPTLTPTFTLPPTVTPTRTPTSCPEVRDALRVPALGSASKPFILLTILEEVVASKPVTLTVSGSLCWDSTETCDPGTLFVVGPGGINPAICGETTDCDPQDPYFGEPHAAFYFKRNGVLGRFASNQAPGATETLPIAELRQDDVIELAVNDAHPANNTLGFEVTLEYTYRQCDP